MAEAHPVGFQWVMEAKARGAKVIHVDPRFSRTSALADQYVPIRAGSDIAFLSGVINYCIKNDKVQWEYVKNFTNATFVVKDGFAYKDGLFTGYDENKRAYDTSTLRDVPFETMSGVTVEPVYGDAPFPGQFPYTRGIFASMYRSRLWTMRMFAGFGTAEDTNGRFKELLRSGGTGLSTAFDMPTLMGRDSDDPHCLGEVGHCGVAIDSAADLDVLFGGIPLEQVTASMTISGPAVPMFCMYLVAAERHPHAPQSGRPRGHDRNRRRQGV